MEISAANTVTTAAGRKVNLKLALFICCMSTFIINVDNTIVNIALPEIGKTFHPKLSQLQWVIDAYLLILASFLVISGSLGDRFGRKKLFQCGLTVFALGSLLCSFAPSIHLLIFFRIVQALGASMLNPISMSLISHMFPKAADKARAFAIWGMMVGLGMASGPLIGGFLVQDLGWGSVFWINVPLCLCVIIGTALFVPESHSETPVSLDFPGQILIFCSLFSLVFCIIELPHAHGIIQIILPVLCIIFFCALILVEKSRSHPLIDLHFFTSIPFSLGTLISVINYIVVGGVLFSNTLYLQDYLGKTAIIAGLLTAPLAIMTAISAQISGMLLNRYGFLIPIIISGSSITVAAIFAAIAINNSSLFLLVLSFMFFGIGLGGANTPINTVAMSGMPKNRSGVAAAIASAGRQTGQTLGVAIAGAILSIHTKNTTPIINYPAASMPIWYFYGFIGIIAIILGFIAGSKRAQASAQNLS